MSYSTSAPPILISTALAGKGNVWEYRSTDAAATVDADGYVTNGESLGMKVGDRVNVHDTDASPYLVTVHTVTEINTDGSVNLSNSDGTDSD